MKIDRRQALGLLGLGAATPALARETGAAFRHGVASGDPLRDRVILWTRVTPADPAKDVAVRWRVFEDEAKTRLASNGSQMARAAGDHTVKVDVTALKPGRDYWYEFEAGGAISPLGRTRTTAAEGDAEVVLAVVSCSLYPNGYFNAYQAVADLDQVDAVLHLGDYIYEYGGEKSYGMDSAVAVDRAHDPAHEIVSLADYRRRHAQYKSDPQLQAAHARAPWIVVWDDHESANDSFQAGAENHQPAEEGDWTARKAAALKAYFEWMPIRDPKPGQSMAEAANRAFHFGDVASLIMLETRLVSRDQQLNYARDLGEAPTPEAIAAFRARMNDPARRMMSAGQEAWVGRELEGSVKAGRAWQVLGNQVVMARMTVPSPSHVPAADRARLAAAAGRLDRMEALSKLGLPYGLDMWDGYGAARDRLYGLMAAAKAHPVVVSGDSHAFWVNELWDAAEGGKRVAAEFGTTGVTSPGAEDALPGLPIGRLYAEQNREVLFSDQKAKGFVKLTLTREAARGELVTVSTIASPTFETAVLKTYEVRPAEDGGVEGLTEL